MLEKEKKNTSSYHSQNAHQELEGTSEWREKVTSLRKYQKPKSLKTNNIINFNTIRYKQTALSNIILSIRNKKPTRAVSILRLHEELKKQLLSLLFLFLRVVVKCCLAQIKKELNEKSVKAN